MGGAVHRDGEGVAVGDLIVYDGLDVDGLQLEVNSHIDQPGDTQREFNVLKL